MPEDEFEIYLTLLAKTLRLGDPQRDAIARELRDHLEQPLAELTEAGCSRHEAIKLALDEFGNASALANDLTRPRLDTFTGDGADQLLTYDELQTRIDFLRNRIDDPSESELSLRSRLIAE